MGICYGVFECYIGHFLAVQAVRLGAGTQPQCGHLLAGQVGAEPLPQSSEAGTLLSSLSYSTEAAQSWGRGKTGPETTGLQVLGGTIKEASTSTNIPDLVIQSSNGTIFLRTFLQDVSDTFTMSEPSDPPFILCLLGRKKPELLQRGVRDRDWLILGALLSKSLPLHFTTGSGWQHSQPFEVSTARGLPSKSTNSYAFRLGFKENCNNLIL